MSSQKVALDVDYTHIFICNRNKYFEINDLCNKKLQRFRPSYNIGNKERQSIVRATSNLLETD